MKSLYYYETPVGTVGIAGTQEAVTNIFCGKMKPPEAAVQETPLLQQAFGQVSEFLNGSRQTLDFPFQAAGTLFQQEVWNALRAIPNGEVRSYMDIARRIHRPEAVRAVGNAIGKNPLLIVIPCHRVIGSDGSLTGFAGGLEVKRFLLELESR